MKRVCIVFQETDDKALRDGQGFNVFLEGAEGTKGKPEDAWTAAEWWGLRMFALCVQAMQSAGATTRAYKKTDS